MLITRVDPPLRLAYLRAAGRLAEVRDAELAFTPEEAASLLGPAASEEAEARCEGWPVALRLVALRGAAPVTGRRRDVAAYLTAEVVDGLPDDLRGFLERTSMLPRLSADLCDHVLERDDSAALLDRVVRANLFVVALDEDGLWWRYHALFAEYLRLRLRRARRRAAPPCLSTGSRRTGCIEDAVDHAAACGDVEMIARTLEAQQVRMSRSGRAATIERWLALLPRELVSARPGVLTAGALAAGGLARPRVEVRRMLGRAEQAREQHPEEWTGYHEAARVLLAALYGDDDVAMTVERSRPGRRARARGRGHARRARDGDAGLGPAARGRGRRRARARARDRGPSDADRRPFGVVGALAVQAVIAAERENAVVAERLAERALFEATRAGVLESTAAGCAHFAAALGALAAGRPVDAERALHRARTIEAAIDGGAMHAWVLATFARTLAARGRTRRAELALEEARGLLAACIDAGAVRRARRAGRGRGGRAGGDGADRDRGALTRRAVRAAPLRGRPHRPRDRRGPVRLDQHRQDAHPLDLPQARRLHARGRARPREGARPARRVIPGLRDDAQRPMPTALLVALGGVAGVLARYGLTVWVQSIWTVVAINLVGSFLLGLLTTAGGHFSNDVRTALGVGVLGGFTTLSTLTVQTVLEADGGRPATAAVYFAVSTVGGLACAALGYAVGRVIA